MASSSYSAIKIPVPGNLIDTPNAQDGDLLRYNGGVYSNFKPLIVDMHPDSNNRSLKFLVSVGTDGSYDANTEAGMFLYKETADAAKKDFSLTINAGPYVDEGRATLDVNGNFSLGKTNLFSLLCTDTNHIPAYKSVIPYVFFPNFLSYGILLKYSFSSGIGVSMR